MNTEDDVHATLVPLTDDELAERAQMLAQAVEKRAMVDSNRKISAAEFRKEIEGLETEIDLLAQMINTRHERRSAQTDLFNESTGEVLEDIVGLAPRRRRKAADR